MSEAVGIEDRVRLTHGIWRNVPGLVVGFGQAGSQRTVLVLLDESFADGPLEVYEWALQKEALPHV